MNSFLLFVSENPMYILIVAVNFIAIILVVSYIVKEEIRNNNDGGIKQEEKEPELDLPPGVSLPCDSPKETVAA